MRKIKLLKAALLSIIVISFTFSQDDNLTERVDSLNVNKEDNKNNSALSVSSRYLSLFPNFIIGTYFPGQLGVYLNNPLKPGITFQKRIIYTTEGHNLNKNQINIYYGKKRTS